MGLFLLLFQYNQLRGFPSDSLSGTKFCIHHTAVRLSHSPLCFAPICFYTDFSLVSYSPSKSFPLQLCTLSSSPMQIPSQLPIPPHSGQHTVLFLRSSKSTSSSSPVNSVSSSLFSLFFLSSAYSRLSYNSEYFDVFSILFQYNLTSRKFIYTNNSNFCTNSTRYLWN